ncbi:MAG TPA: trypsin-like peptidase domain-containing protein, partial [Acidimicrobiales bacterium]|nr:trypsin-like peptidase domain-containing protein [Acidimicrobiales bacterium]
MGEEHEGDGGKESEWRETVSPVPPETPSEPSPARSQESADTPLADSDRPSPSSSSALTPPGVGWTGAEPFAEEPAGARSPRRRRTGVVFVSTLVVVALAAGAASVIGHTSSHPRTSSPTSVTAVGSTASPSTLPVETTGQIVGRLEPAVVDINTINQTLTGYAIAAGTGMIVSQDGYIVTNNHVVEQATSIKVSIEGHATPYRATFVGADPAADIAVIKVAGLAGLPTVSFATSSSLGVGAPVVAIGNAHGRGGRPAVTTGTVLALNRSIVASNEIVNQPEQLTGMIETSARIEPGNSGGPLVDDHAQVVGMVTAANARGTGYALPESRVAAIASTIEKGHAGDGVLLGLQAFLGVVGQLPSSTGTHSGVLVTRIVLGDPAANAGIVPDDTI